MSSANRILVIEDEAAILRGLQENLEREGYRVASATTVASALRELAQPHDLVVLDRRLPDGEGLDVLRFLRSRGDRTPVIVLSARSQTNDRVQGLEDGADDYISKPFHLRELVARIRAVLQRAQAGVPPAPTMFRFGDCELDLAARVLRRGRKVVDLARMEFDLLQYLALQAGRTVSRTELLDRVWGYDRFPTTRTVDYHVLALRKKCELDPSHPQHLLTVHGVGYRLQA